MGNKYVNEAEKDQEPLSQKKWFWQKWIEELKKHLKNQSDSHAEKKEKRDDPLQEDSSSSQEDW